MQRKRLSILLVTAVALLGLMQFGPYPFTVPKALLTIATNKSWLVPLTPDATKMVGRRRIADRELDKYLTERGWTHTKTHEDPSCSLACNEEMLYQKGEDTLTIRGRFRKGYWWYELDQAP